MWSGTSLQPRMLVSCRVAPGELTDLSLPVCPASTDAFYHKTVNIVKNALHGMTFPQPLGQILVSIGSIQPLCLHVQVSGLS